MSSLQIKNQDSLLQVTLNRPEVRNAMNAECIQELKECFESVDQNVLAVVLRGSNSFFCAGGDLNWMKSSFDKSAEENEKDALELARMLHALDDCSVPVVSIVEGGAFGGGVGLLAASDIVIAEENTLFSLSEVKLGLIPATIGPLVLRKIGISQARRLYLTGLRFKASVAQQIGLVHEVVAASELQNTLNAYLKEIGSAGPQAIKTAKSLVKELVAGDLWNANVCEETSKLLSKVRIGEEAQEGMAAFLEKRKANWREPLGLK